MGSTKVNTLVDLFAGAGGGSIGFTASGFKSVGAVEIDPTAAASFRVNLGVDPICADIRTVSGATMLNAAGLKRGQLTLLFGCPPCQSFTVLRRGAECTA
ncbi:MAG TPA: DNA cytosine methyltransferase, partial [Galbitalea sp.]